MILVSNLQRVSSESEKLRLNRVYANWKEIGDLNPELLMLTPWTESLKRTSQSLGENACSPFVKDLIDLGMKRDSVVLLINGDAHLVRDFKRVIKDSFGVHQSEALYSHRRNFMKPLRNLLDSETIHRKGIQFEGVDSLVITKEWWKKKRDKLPDLLMGFEGWDWIYKFEIGSLMDTELTYHEHHMPYWYSHRTTTPGQTYNRKLCLEWGKSQTVLSWNELVKVWPEMLTF